MIGKCFMFQKFASRKYSKKLWLNVFNPLDVKLKISKLKNSEEKFFFLKVFFEKFLAFLLGLKWLKNFWCFKNLQLKKYIKELQLNVLKHLQGKFQISKLKISKVKICFLKFFFEQSWAFSMGL